MTGTGRQRKYAEAPRSRPWRAKALASNSGLLAWLRAGAPGQEPPLAEVRFLAVNGRGLTSVKGTRSMAAMVAPERDEPWATASKFVALGFADASVEPPLT
jgi:hypothetical protein